MFDIFLRSHWRTAGWNCRRDWLGLNGSFQRDQGVLAGEHRLAFFVQGDRHGFDVRVLPGQLEDLSLEFFEVEKYPEITFRSTKVEKKGKGWIVTGDFTMKGVTKSITFPFQIVGWLSADARSGGKMGIAAETMINRRDFGVNWGGNLPGTSIPAVADMVKISLQIDGAKKK